MQIQSDVSTGAFLSGGIDSSLVVSLMNKISNKKINTFSIGFEDQNYDESNYSKQIAEYLNTNHHCHIFKSKELLGLIENLSDVYDEPFADSSDYQQYYCQNLLENMLRLLSQVMVLMNFFEDIIDTTIYLKNF